MNPAPPVTRRRFIGPRVSPGPYITVVVGVRVLPKPFISTTHPPRRARSHGRRGQRPPRAAPALGSEGPRPRCLGNVRGGSHGGPNPRGPGGFFRDGEARPRHSAKNRPPGGGDDACGRLRSA